MAASGNQPVSVDNLKAVLGGGLTSVDVIGSATVPYNSAAEFSAPRPMSEYKMIAASSSAAGLILCAPSVGDYTSEQVNEGFSCSLSVVDRGGEKVTFSNNSGMSCTVKVIGFH